VSQLFCTETGRFWPALGEELAYNRWARKVLHLPRTELPATLFVLARPHSLTSPPLRVSVNGVDTTPQAPTTTAWEWLSLVVHPRLLRTGPNRIEVRCDSVAMDGWSLALELGHADPASFLSRDGGRSWQNGRLGFADLAPGEYAVRVRLHEGSDPSPPAFVWERDLSSLERLLALVPRAVTRPGQTLDQAARISTWVSRQWDYYRESPLPAPWDPATIITWGRARQGHGGYRARVHCVHYAVTFAMLCNAAGIPARCSALVGSMTPREDADTGHFVAEVWAREYQKWVLVDPTLDGLAIDGRQPFSVQEVQSRASALNSIMRWGAGHARQLRGTTLRHWTESVFLPGRWLGYRALWPRMDLVTRPDLAAASHGAMAYSETSLVWEDRALDHGFGMFGLFAPEEYFSAPPESFPGAV
jgi:transglutaminase-like putative cysteine protease